MATGRGLSHYQRTSYKPNTPCFAPPVLFYLSSYSSDYNKREITVITILRENFNPKSIQYPSAYRGTYMCALWVSTFHEGTVLVLLPERSWVYKCMIFGQEMSVWHRIHNPWLLCLHQRIITSNSSQKKVGQKSQGIVAKNNKFTENKVHPEIGHP